MYAIIFSENAIKALKKIPIDYQRKIKDTTAKLSKNPFALDIKKLGSSYKATHRLRIGQYRLFLQIDTSLKGIIIAHIERRTTQTYR